MSHNLPFFHDTKGLDEAIVSRVVPYLPDAIMLS